MKSCSKIFGLIVSLAVLGLWSAAAGGSLVAEAAAGDSRSSGLLAQNTSLRPVGGISPENGLKTRLGGMDFQAADLREALGQAARKGGLVVDVPADFRGTVTLNIEDVSLEEALQVMLAPAGWSWICEGDILHVIPAAKTAEGSEKVTARIFPLKYIPALEIFPELKALKSPEGKLWLDTRARQVVALDRPQVLEAMEAQIRRRDFPRRSEDITLKYITARKVLPRLREEFKEGVQLIARDDEKGLSVTAPDPLFETVLRRIAEWDRRRDALLEARLIQVHLNEEHKDGVDWEGFVFDYHALPVKDGGETATARFGTISSEDYAALMESLDMVGEKSDSSSTRISVAGGEAAHLQLNIDTANAVMTMSTPFIASAGPERGETASGTLEFYLRPSVTEDNTLRLTIMPIPETGDDKVTFTMAEDGIVVIGGMFREEQVTSANKIPLLGDLPLFGGFFRNQNTRMHRVEYVVFLIPKIVLGPDATDAAAAP